MLIVDGPDLLGKSRLCDELEKEINRRTRCQPRVTRDHFGLDEKDYTLTQHIRNLRRWHVRDRMHVSQLVYDRAVRQKQTALLGDWDRLHDALAAVGGLTVVVYAASSAYRDRLNQKFDANIEEFNVGELAVVNDGFRFVVEHMAEQWGWMTMEIESADQFPSASKVFVDDVVRTYTTRQRTVDRVWEEVRRG